MTAMVRYEEGFVLRLASTAGNSHPGPMLTFFGDEGTLEYHGDSFKLYHQPRTENFDYSVHSWPAATVSRFKALMSLNDKLEPLDGPVAAEPTEYRSSDEDATRAHVRTWIEAIRGSGRPIEDARTGHNAALVGHMCNIAYRAGKPARWNRRTRQVEA
jgi:hypothetical protein